MTQVILPPASPVFRCFSDLVECADKVFFAGLPGVGKSLLLQQLTLMALEAGREVHLLQWDTARQVFETPRYPLRDGATDPMVIKAVGLWLRQALVDWDRDHDGLTTMLIGEVPLIGGRLMEIARPADDKAEPLLRDMRTQFVLPVPSMAVHALIESKREQSIANPRHENERQDAPPGLLRESWQDLFLVAAELGICDSSATNAPYSPRVYAAVYRHLLRHRQVKVLEIGETLQSDGSVYDFEVELPQLKAGRKKAEAILAALEATTSDADEQKRAAKWYEL